MPHRYPQRVELFWKQMNWLFMKLPRSAKFQVKVSVMYCQDVLIRCSPTSSKRLSSEKQHFLSPRMPFLPDEMLTDSSKSVSNVASSIKLPSQLFNKHIYNICYASLPLITIFTQQLSCLTCCHSLCSTHSKMEAREVKSQRGFTVPCIATRCCAASCWELSVQNY